MPVTRRISPTRIIGAYPTAWNFAARLPRRRASTSDRRKTVMIGANAAVYALD
jgi:hypothetical protein